MTTWQEFRDWFKANYLKPRRLTNKETVRAVERSIGHFERLCRPKRLADIDAKTFDAYVAKRRRENVTDGTIGKDIDHVRVAFNFAVEQGALAESPPVPRLEDQRREARIITPEHFRAIWSACGHSDWWRAFLAAAVSTPFYVKELLKLRWDGLDLDNELATLPADATDRRRWKPKKAKLPAVGIKYLRKLAKKSESPEVFAWPKRPKTRNGHIVGESEKNALERWAEGNRSGLWKAFRDIQEQAGVRLPCDREHRHTDLCWYYGFDDLRVAAILKRGAELLHHAEDAKRAK